MQLIKFTDIVPNRQRKGGITIAHRSGCILPEWFQCAASSV